MKVEYRVRPVTRYVVTRWQDDSAGDTDTKPRVDTKGEYDNEQTAYEVGYALTKEEHNRLGYPLGDKRIKYPDNPAVTCAGAKTGASASTDFYVQSGQSIRGFSL